MKLFSVFLLICSSVAMAEECSSISTKVVERNLVWSQSQAKGKTVIIKNLDTNLLYPKEVSVKTTGVISLGDLTPNKNGYQLILASLPQATLNQIQAHTASCFKKGDCSMKADDVALSREACRYTIKTESAPTTVSKSASVETPKFVPSVAPTTK